MKTLTICIAITAAMLATGTPAQQSPIQGFANVHPIDAHVHVYTETPSINAFLIRNNLHFIDIAVLDDRDPFYKSFTAQYDGVESVIHGTPGHVSLCTTFSPYDFESPTFADRVIKQLNENFAQGAVAVKIYKTIGMEIKKKDGTYLMPDDPVFQPIYQDIAAHNRTVIAHLAEPTPAGSRPTLQAPTILTTKPIPANTPTHIPNGLQRKPFLLPAITSLNRIPTSVSSELIWAAWRSM